MSNTMVKKVLVGHVSVDSGTVMIIDPCYVLPDDRKGLATRTPSAWDDIPEGETSVYLGALHTALNDPNTTATRYGKEYGEFGLGILSSTYYGDGTYPVTAEIDGSGRVLRLTIDFDPSYEG